MNPKYTFDTFVVGKNNDIAHATALAVAEDPGSYGNPLFIYGGAGLGKTHLLHSVAHYILSKNPNYRIIYVTSEDFTNELVFSIAHKQTEAFNDIIDTVIDHVGQNMEKKFSAEYKEEVKNLNAAIVKYCLEGTRYAEKYAEIFEKRLCETNVLVPPLIRNGALGHCEVKFLYDNGVPASAREELEKLFGGESVVIQKRTKRKEMADVDIRPMIEKLSIIEEDCVLRIDAFVSAQNPGLNPALLENAVARYLPDLKPDFVTVRRLEMLDAEGKPFR